MRYRLQPFHSITDIIHDHYSTQFSPFPRFMDKNHLSWFDPIQLKQTHPICRELINNKDCSRVSFHFTTTTYQSSTHQRITNTDSITIKQRINSLSTTYQWNGRFLHHPILHSPVIINHFNTPTTWEYSKHERWNRTNEYHLFHIE